MPKNHASIKLYCFNNIPGISLFIFSFPIIRYILGTSYFDFAEAINTIFLHLRILEISTARIPPKERPIKVGLSAVSSEEIRFAYSDRLSFSKVLSNQ